MSGQPPSQPPPPGTPPNQPPANQPPQPPNQPAAPTHPAPPIKGPPPPEGPHTPGPSTPPPPSMGESDIKTPAPAIASGDSSGAGGTKKKWLLGGLAALAAVVIGGGAWAAFSFLAGSDDELAGMVPDDAAVYVHVNFDPSAENKLGIKSLVDRLEEATGEPDALDGLIDNFSDEVSTEFEGFDIEEAMGFVGNQAALWVAEPTSSETFIEAAEPTDTAALVALKDEDAARAFVEDHSTGTWTDQGIEGWQLDDAVATIHDGILVVGMPDAVVDTVEVEPDGSLATFETFSNTVSKVPEGVVTAYVNTSAVEQQDMLGMEGALPQDLPPAVAASVSFADGRMVVQSATAGELPYGTEQIAPLQLETMPGNGQMYWRLPDLGTYTGSLVRSLESDDTFGDEDFVAELDTELERYDTSFEEIRSWMGDLLIVGGYQPTEASDNAFLQMHLGTSDEQATQDLLDRVLADIPDDSYDVTDGTLTAGDVVVEVADGRLQVRVGEGVGTLADSERYTATVDDMPGEVTGYIGLREITEAVAAFVGPDIDDGDEALLQGLGALDALAFSVDSDAGLAQMRLTWATDYEAIDIDDTEPHAPALDVGPVTIEDFFNGSELPPVLPDPEPEVPPSGEYGSDPQLDALWDACEDGDAQACTDLFLQSPLDSEYEEFGQTCGNRTTETLPDCDEVINGPTTDPQDNGTYGSDPQLDALWDACENGDAEACTDLFLQSPLDSEYEEFGQTCGDRTTQTSLDCEAVINGSESEDDANGPEALGDPVPFDQLEVTGCYDLPDEQAFRFLTVRDCTQPHDIEVIAIGTIDADSHDDVDTAAEAQVCTRDMFQDYVGVPYIESKWFVNWLTPTPESFTLGDRTVYCVATVQDGKASEPAFQSNS